MHTSSHDGCYALCCVTTDSLIKLQSFEFHEKFVEDTLSDAVYNGIKHLYTYIHICVSVHGISNNVIYSGINDGIVLDKTCYVYSYSIRISIVVSIISISEFLWVAAAEDEGVCTCGVGDVSKVSDVGCVSAA